MKLLRLIHAVIRLLAVVLLVFMAIASVTHDAIQEVCSTVLYLGLGVTILLLFVERLVERSRFGEYAD